MSWPGPVCSGQVWSVPPLEASPASDCFKQPPSVSDKSKVESSSGTAPGTAAMPVWIGLEPVFTDLKRQSQVREWVYGSDE